MTNKDYVLETMRRYGRMAALAVQEKSTEMNGTELNAEDSYIPAFHSACAKMNMLERKAGFVCISPYGRVVRLLQPYDSDVFTQAPEDLPAQFGFVWSTDPAKAKPFIALSTSPYNTGECCTHEGHVWRSGQDGNVWAPGTPNVKWEEVTI